MIDVARDFSRFPAGRDRTDGKYSGQAFREDFVRKALRAADRLAVQMDGAVGYGSSFLEEAFGGLVRKDDFGLQDLEQRLEIVTEDGFLKDEIWGYIFEAANAPRLFAAAG